MHSRLLLLALAAAGLAACGPVQTTTSIGRAEEELRTARLASADRDSPYEYTKARMMLDMAKMCEGRSEFQAAKEFGDEALRLAAKAKENGPKNARLRQIRLSAPPPAPGTPVPALPASPGEPAVPAPVTPGGRP
ncbi:MAG: DUF4398 domain-containing protein [Deltaproteobacteria bacterium]|nr:DUF4398 domain-containing protein [Deltaproteobacteria bacterium]